MKRYNPSSHMCGSDIGEYVKYDCAQSAIEAERKKIADLLEALEMFESWWRSPNDARTVQSIEPAMSKALDAIRRAKGEA